MKSIDDRVDIREFATSMGSMVALESDYLFDPDDQKAGAGATLSATYADKPNNIDPQELAKLWNISEDIAKETVKITTQRVKRSTDPTLTRHFPTNGRMHR